MSVIRIANMKIKNFRCITNSDIRFDQLTILMGRNGSGKSSVLNALNVFFSPEIKITKQDFFNDNVDDPIEIEIQMNDFTTEESNDLANFIENGAMTLLKRISFDKETENFRQEYFSYLSQIPEFAAIRQLKGAREQTDAYKELKDNKFPELATVRNVGQVLEQMTLYEKGHPDLTRVLPVKGNWKLDNYTKLIVLPAVKEASDEIEGKNSSIVKLLEILVLQKIENRNDLIQFKKDMLNAITEKYSPKNLGGLEELSNNITRTLNRYAPGSAVELQWGEVQQPEIVLPSVLTNVYEDGYGGSIVNKGHGLQRALILTVLEHLATTITEDNETKPEESTEKVQQKETPRIDTIIAIEEPELYLHPSRAKYLSKILAQLASPENTTKKAHTQIIYSTHSPYFVGLDRFDNLRVCRKVKDGTKIPHTKIDFTDLQSTAQRFEQLSGRARQYNDIRQNFKVRSANIITTAINEGFFADFVVLIEGASDSGVIWKVQEVKGKNWDKHSISVIPAGGKSNLIRIKSIFDALKIPNYTIFDKDAVPGNNTKMLRLLGVAGTDLPPDKIHDTWAYNDIKLEDELQNALTQPVYEQIWNDVKTELECPDDNIRKNEEAIARFVETVYEKKIALKHLEDIIEKICNQACLRP